MIEPRNKLAQFIVDHRWAYLLFRYVVLPVNSVWVICRHELPEVWAEYQRDLKSLDEDMADYRAKQATPVTVPAPKASA